MIRVKNYNYFRGKTNLLCSPKLHLFDQKYSKNINIVKNDYNLSWLFSMWIYILDVIYSCDGKAEFSASLLHVTWSSEIIIICWFAA